MKIFLICLFISLIIFLYLFDNKKDSNKTHTLNSILSGFFAAFMINFLYCWVVYGFSLINVINISDILKIKLPSLIDGISPIINLIVLYLVLYGARKIFCSISPKKISTKDITASYTITIIISIIIIFIHNIKELNYDNDSSVTVEAIKYNVIPLSILLSTLIPFKSVYSDKSFKEVVVGNYEEELKNANLCIIILSIFFNIIFGIFFIFDLEYIFKPKNIFFVLLGYVSGLIINYIIFKLSNNQSITS